MHKAFMAEIGEEMCQAEVAHHANICPEYFYSRPVKYVHIYKKALGISTGKKEAVQEDEEDVLWSSEGEVDEDAHHYTRDTHTRGGAGSPHKSKRVTKMSDVDLYENRTMLSFEKSAGLSPHLPRADSPEQQVASASLFDFFRFVQHHGGKHPYLTWYAKDEFPIVIMSPVLKLAEGPNFAFGARWALMQYHAWHNRNEILDASDADVKLRFRKWTYDSVCPWYIREDYAAANRSTRRARRSHATIDPKENNPTEGRSSSGGGCNGNGNLVRQ